jgi:hypothetical protein
MKFIVNNSSDLIDNEPLIEFSYSLPYKPNMENCIRLIPSSDKLIKCVYSSSCEDYYFILENSRTYPNHDSPSYFKYAISKVNKPLNNNNKKYIGKGKNLLLSELEITDNQYKECFLNESYYFYELNSPCDE